MPNVPIPLVGPTYTNRSLPVSAQVTKNMYIESNPAGDELISLMPFPGLKLFAATGSGKNRGMGEYNNELYAVTGATLYKISVSGVVTSLGAIPGSNECVLTTDGVSLVITYGSGKPITWNGSTLTVGTDADLPNASTSSYITRRIVYDGNGASIAFSEFDTALDVDSDDVALVESSPDDVLAVIEQDEQVIVFTEKKIVPHYFSDSGSPPFDPIQNSIKNIGLRSVHSLSQNPAFLYFLGSDLNVYRYSGLQVQPIGNPAIGQAIESYVDQEKAKGECFTIQHQNFYYLTFPGQASWLFSESSSTWTSLSYGTQNDSHLINSLTRIYNKNYVGDRLTGNIYELDTETYTDNGAVIHRQRDTAAITGRDFGSPGKEIFMDKLILTLETGASLVSSEAKLMMQYSDDNGRSYSAERWMTIGALGDYGTAVEWDEMGSFYSRMFRFTMSAAIKWTLIRLDAEVSIGT